MLLTLFFMVATWLQSWRLQTVYAQLARLLVGQRTSIAFVATAPTPPSSPQRRPDTVDAKSTPDAGTSCTDAIASTSNSETDAASLLDAVTGSGGNNVIGEEDTTDSTRTAATSDLCTNASMARITDHVWSGADGRRQGVALTPRQHLQLGPWIQFPAAPTLLPFTLLPGVYRSAADEPELHVLLEMQVDAVRVKENNVLRIEDFGRPIAWKLDSRFAVLLATDLRGLAALVTRSFMQDNLVVNDYLPMVRIETVEISGEPQPFASIRQHSRPELCARSRSLLTTDQWQTHVANMRQLNILASQASEFQRQRMRTEGKTGLCKPDLIPLGGSEGRSGQVSAPSPLSASPRRQLPNEAPASAALDVQQISRPSARISPRTSPLRLIPELGETNATASVKIEDTGKVVDAVTSSISPKKPTPIELSPCIADVAVKANGTFEAAVSKTPVNELKTSEAVVPQPPSPLADIKPQPDLAPVETSASGPATSVRSSGAIRPILVRSKGSLLSCKPPNVLVYSESAATRDTVIQQLAGLLAPNVYTVYPLSAAEVRTRVWIDNTTMLVVCGTVAAPDIGLLLTEYFLGGGAMLSLCSDLLHLVLPAFRTHAEVREHELVQFSYGRWQRVRMMHHIFCYQPSPVRKHFSTDSEESTAASAASGSGGVVSRAPTSLVCPRSVEVDDMQQKTHSLQVQVLGTEETWNTPSLILASNAATGGKAVFSQVHLEADPANYEHDDTKFAVLRQSNAARMEIFSDLLGSQLGIAVRSADDRKQVGAAQQFACGYFLGDYMVKFELLERLKAIMTEPKTLKLPRLTVRFCGHREEPPAATEILLPVLINACPDNFSTIDYYDNLKTKHIGRLAIYVPVITSTTHVLAGAPLAHGLAVIARRQTAGSGRTKNQWLSPDGCLMFSVQLHIELSSPLGQRLSLLQHLVAVAMVNAVLGIDGYEVLNIRLKWPNDIYANGRTKIGGLIVSSQIDASRAVCNIGCGLNLSNSTPTLCINDLISAHNAQLKGGAKPLAALGHERLLALIFTELERLFVAVQAGDLRQLYELYDQLWLHSDAEVNILDANGVRKTSKIIGIDEYGFLLVQRNGEPAESVHPDGNSFDMLRGLIVPKTN